MWGVTIAILACAITVTAGPVIALDESVVFEQITAAIENGRPCESDPQQPFWTVKVAKNPKDGYRIRYSRFGCSVGAVGTIVLAPGRSEPSYEFYETAIDLVDRGYSPVYVIDHRGQGLSPRLLEDTLKGHIDNFRAYVDDLDSVLSAVRAEFDDSGWGEESNLFFLSNSMGGAIGIGHLQRYGTESPLRAAAFLGLMVHVNYLSFTGLDPTWLNQRIYSESGALLQSRWRCGPGALLDSSRCEDFASPETFGTYETGSRLFIPDNEQMMTHSAARYALRTYLWDEVDWSDFVAQIYQPDENWTGPQLGGSTNGWVRAAALFNREVRQGHNLARMVHVPVMLVTGTRDLRAYKPYGVSRSRMPDLSRHEAFCDALNTASLEQTGQYICHFVPLNGGFHELLKERDAERDIALDTIDWFFRANAQ